MALGKPKLLGKTPDDEEVNALLVEGAHDAILRRYSDPKASDRQVAIMVLDTTRVTDDKGKGRQANLVIQHIELPKGANLEMLEELLISAYRDRTGKQALPGEPDTAGQLDLSGLDEHTTPGEVAKADDDAAFDAAAADTAAADTAAADTAVDPEERASAPVTPIR